ncbi:MAG: EamA family transporter RarD [Alicyclobacillus sp.]|nr:EamA family transporter RarD [Alicyclobacillus sp.]
MASRKGLLYAVLAYAGWGVLPAYWKLFQEVPALEVLAHRVVWSTAFMWLLVLLARRTGPVREAVRSGGRMKWMALGAGLITVNWLGYIFAVNSGHIVEASLGYYINPLVNVLLGMWFLREKLSAGQWVAMGFAASGVAVMIAAYGHVPWLALMLAVSFGLYGLTKKKVSAEAVASLTWETTVVCPLAGLYLAGLHVTHGDTVGALPGWDVALLLCAGVVTALPLLWFGVAAKHLDLATLGMVQYLSPSLSLLLGVMVYRETFTGMDLLAFALIWAALAVYTGSSWRSQRLSRQVALAGGEASAGSGGR